MGSKSARVTGVCWDAGSGRTLGDGPGDDSVVGAMEREFAAVALGGAKAMSDTGEAGAGRKLRPSAYILFCVDRRPSVAAGGLSFGDVARALSVGPRTHACACSGTGHAPAVRARMPLPAHRSNSKGGHVARPHNSVLARTPAPNTFA
jgi:hypothetical protein